MLSYAIVLPVHVVAVSPAHPFVVEWSTIGELAYSFCGCFGKNRWGGIRSCVFVIAVGVGRPGVVSGRDAFRGHGGVGVVVIGKEQKRCDRFQFGQVQKSVLEGQGNARERVS